MDNKIIITNKNSIVPKHKSEHPLYEYNKYEVIPRGGQHPCYVAIYEIPPQKANYPYHYHLNNVEVFYIISGTGMLETPDGNKVISAGDVVVCPPLADGAHKVINSSQTEMLVYLDCDTIHSPDVVHYPHTDKVGIIVGGEPGVFYRKGCGVGYYEGE